MAAPILLGSNPIITQSPWIELSQRGNVPLPLTPMDVPNLAPSAQLAGAPPDQLHGSGQRTRDVVKRTATFNVGALNMKLQVRSTARMG